MGGRGQSTPIPNEGRTTIEGSSGAQEGSGFSRFKLGRSIQRGIAAAGFTDPRPIQDETIPSVLAGRDLLGLAPTGTGKTAAFALPILERLLEGRKLEPGRRADGPRVLIVAPTRELALQITEEIRLLAKFTSVKAVAIIGGVSMRPQVNALRAKPEIVVACPGRLLDLYGQGVVRLNRVEILVLDEADHMFDMGFLPDVRRILAALPKKRQNLLFSATMPREIRSLADHVLHRPHSAELAHSMPPSTIDHSLYPIAEKSKLDLLKRVLSEKGFVSAIVFTRTKHRAKRLADKLAKIGVNAVALQGNMSQGQRQRAMEGFRKERFDVLVATDIAARGIDVAQVSHVINFDMPNTPDAYTHRIGRTGRAEREGKAYTFVTADDRGMVRQVEHRIGKPIPRLTYDGVASVPFPSAGKDHSSKPRPSSANHDRRTGPNAHARNRYSGSDPKKPESRAETNGAAVPRGVNRRRRKRIRGPRA